MDIETLGRTLGFSLAAGVNLYATVAILGLAARYGWVDLPAQFQVFNHDVVIGAAIVMYLVEFLADKIPYFDSLWDGIHTLIRPVGGALVAVGTLGEASPAVEGLVALLGGTVAAGSHLTKTSTRAAANASPEPFSNWLLSIGEDVFVIGLGALALKYPTAALIVTAIAVALIAVFAAVIVRTVRRWFRRWFQHREAPAG
jgi:Na+-transporting NADH:ubiquinone oxidoreductase subunit NqrD